LYLVRSDAKSCAICNPPRAILSGTPMPNDYTDLWTQITSVPGKQVWGSHFHIGYRCEDDADRLYSPSLRPFFFRVAKSDLGLPSPKLTDKNVS